MHERDLFIAALEIEDEMARREYLHAACAGDPALLVRVERLLRRDSDAGDFLEHSAADLCSDMDPSLPTQAIEPPASSSDLPSMIGQADDTAQTIVETVPPAGDSHAVVPPSFVSTESSLVLGTLFGRYRVERVLGTGGMGVVYLAEDMRLGRRVALKIPKFDADGKLKLSERFRREARTMASVLHRNLCPIFDVDEQDGTHYLTMAFIEGESLAQVIKREQTAGSGFHVTSDRPLTSSATQIADLIRKLALALDEAHRAGIIHRDLKPSNVMFDRSGEPILMDFGLAWMAHEADARVTQSGAIIGTPAYMSPEQAEGDADKIGTASDIYSLGAILYELLAGRPIHTGGVTRVLFKLIHEAPTRPSEVRGDVDPNLEAICWKAISKLPEDRFASAAEFAAALSRFIEGQPWESKAHTEPRTGEKRAAGRHVSAGASSSQNQFAKPDRTDVLPPDTGAETIAYQTPGSPSSKALRGKSRMLLATLLLIGALGTVWAIVVNRPKSTGDDSVQLPDSRGIPTDGKDTSQSLPKTEAVPAHQADFALEFDGKSTYVLIPTLKRDQTEPVTIEAWVEAIEPKKSNVIVALGGKAYCSLNVSDRNWFGNDPTLQGFLQSPVTKGLVHLAFVADDQEGRLFVDGKLVDRSPRTDGLEDVEEAHAWLGAGLHKGSPNYFFRGRLRELSIAKVARYGEEFDPAQRFVADQHTLALYHFDEGSGTELKDSSGNDNHGQIVGAKWVEVASHPITSPLGAGIAKAPFNANQARTHQAAWAKHLGTTVETINSVGATMILIPPGEFLMGSTDEQVAAAAKTAEEINAESVTKDRISKVERPQHAVVITKPFHIGATEVTIAQFKKFSATGYRTEAEKLVKDATSETYLTPGYTVTDDSPAAVITWNDALAYCRWLSDIEKETYRLPTEAEWEYACRAGTTTQFSFGDNHQELDQFAWFNSNSESRSHEVGLKRPNAFGLYDMHGNLWEWCHDFYDEKWYEKSPTIDPTGSLSGSQHVIRGGYWPGSASTCRSAHRGRTIAANRSNHFGFRIVREFHTISRTQALSPTPLNLEPAAPLPAVTRAAGLKLGDLDGDGDLDLFVAMLKAPCVVLRNDGRGRFTDSGQQLGDNEGFAVALGDLDGDGDLDAFVANTGDQENAIWLNDGRGMFQRSPQAFPPSHSNDVALADVDGDKDLDVVVSNWIGDVTVWTNDGAGRFTSQQTIPRRSNTGVALGDLDGDGDADLVMTSIGGDNRVWLNDGGGQFADSEQQIELAQGTSVALGDLDRDGDLDLFITGHQGNQVWFNNSQGRFQASEQRLGDGQCEAVELVDLDADHDLDAVTIGGGFELAKPRSMWRNDGHGRFAKVATTFKTGRTQSLTIGDLDGDGDADVIFGNLSEPAEVWLNQSNQSTIP